jgi:hypothetical protein
MLNPVDLRGLVDRIGDEICHSCQARSYLRCRVLVHGTCMPRRLQVGCASEEQPPPAATSPQLPRLLKITAVASGTCEVAASECRTN